LGRGGFHQVRAEKKAKDEAALQKMREAQVLAGDRSAAAFLEAKAEKAKAAEAKNKLSVKEQAALDQQAEEKRAAFEAEMKVSLRGHTSRPYRTSKRMDSHVHCAHCRLDPVILRSKPPKSRQFR
jgi:hypothetical protein